MKIEVFKLKESGHSIRKIAQILGISKNTVKRILKSIESTLSTEMGSQNRMFHFFGGVPKYLVVDNLKSGVFRAHRYDPDLNSTYCDYANHMGFAVLLARPATPRDKPAIEGAIRVIQRQFYAEMRNKTFYSLCDLNLELRKYIERLNSAAMKDYGCTRAQRFELEKSLLRSLPPASFEITERRMAKVHPDCHIQVDRCFYSATQIKKKKES
jgi:hypothetical protein